MVINFYCFFDSSTFIYIWLNFYWNFLRRTILFNSYFFNSSFLLRYKLKSLFACLCWFYFFFYFMFNLYFILYIYAFSCFFNYSGSIFIFCFLLFINFRSSSAFSYYFMLNFCSSYTYLGILHIEIGTHWNCV